MAKFDVTFQISRRKIPMTTIKVDTCSASKDPSALATRCEIREAMKQTYDCMPDLIELQDVTTHDGKKHWSAYDGGQDKQVVDALAQTSDEQTATAPPRGIRKPTVDQIMTAKIDQLRQTIVTFDLDIPGAETMVSEELAPLVADAMYPGVDVTAATTTP